MKGHRRIQCWRLGGGAYRKRGRGRSDRGRGRGSRGRGNWTNHNNNSGGCGDCGTRDCGRRSYRGGNGDVRQSGATKGAASVSYAVADNTAEPVAYCFLTACDEKQTMDSENNEQVAQCLSEVGKQKLSVMNSYESVWYLDSEASNHLIQPVVPVVNKRKLGCPVPINIAKKNTGNVCL